MFAPNQRVKVNLANLTIQGEQFSQNVQEALGTVLEQISTDPDVSYRAPVQLHESMQCPVRDAP